MRGAALRTCALAALCGVVLAAAAWAQTAPVPPPATAVAPVAPSVSTAAPIRPAPVRRAPSARAESSPHWGELSARQQASLTPLAGIWPTLSQAQKRKWIALSRNYPTLSPDEQARLHSRMTEWASLSPQQRTQARLNFAATKALPSTDKKAKWEAYQALPAEEKKKLASRAARKPVPPPTAAAVRPVPKQKLAHLPHPRKPDNGARVPVVPGQVDRHTLLPQPGALPQTP